MPNDPWAMPQGARPHPRLANTKGEAGRSRKREAITPQADPYVTPVLQKTILDHLGVRPDG